MTTFDFEISKKDQDGSDSIFKVNRFLLRLLSKRMKEEKMTRKKLADILELDKSTVSRMLRGNQNLTARTIGEICGALNFDFELVERDLKKSGVNYDLHNVGAFQMKELAASPAPSTSGQSLKNWVEGNGVGTNERMKT